MQSMFCLYLENLFHISILLTKHFYSGFDHRPFVLNWCMSLKVIDSFVVDPIERYKYAYLFKKNKNE